LGNVEIINLNNFWGRNIWSFHIYSWDLDIIFDPWFHSWEMGVVILIRIQSWDFNISNESTVSIRKRHLMWLVAAQCIDASDHQFQYGNYVPTAVKKILSGVQSHELETALQIYSRTERNCSLGTGELAVTRVIFLVHLAVLSDMKTQVLLVV
jgi:hypothetical protein